MFFTMKCNDGTVKYCCQTLKNAAMKEANCHKHYTSRIYIYITQSFKTLVALFIHLCQQSIYRLVSSYQLNAHFLYSITIYMLHYNP